MLILYILLVLSVAAILGTALALALRIRWQMKKPRQPAGEAAREEERHAVK